MARPVRAIAPRRSEQKGHLVFVSHATYDKWIAKVLCEKLEAPAVGATTFRDDRDIAGGDSILQTIKSRIRDCDEMVVLLTPESVNRGWVMIEVGMAEILEKRITPLLYHVDPGSIPDVLRDRRAYEIDQFDEFIKAVRERARKS